MNKTLNKQELLSIIATNNMPKEIKKYLKSSDKYNIIDFDNTHSIYIKEKGAYLKIGENLKDEMLNTMYFNKKGLSGEIIEFIQDDNYDYLLIKEIEGQNGIQEEYLDNPKKLAKYYGKYLREIHSIDYKDSPNILIMETLINNAREKVENREFNMQNFFEDNGFTPQKGLLILEDLKNCCINDVYLHGDYRLENIIMDEFKLKGVIGLNKCGVGDRHYDICFALNSLKKHFKTKEYSELFLESYGYDKIDKDRLIFCKTLTILS